MVDTMIENAKCITGPMLHNFGKLWVISVLKMLKKNIGCNP